MREYLFPVNGFYRQLEMLTANCFLKRLEHYTSIYSFPVFTLPGGQHQLSAARIGPIPAKQKANPMCPDCCGPNHRNAKKMGVLLLFFKLVMQAKALDKFHAPGHN